MPEKAPDRGNSDDTGKSPLGLTLRWSEDKPAWQRDALRRIVEQGSLTESDFWELVAICEGKRAGIPLAREHLGISGAPEGTVLLSLSGVRGVNKLAPNQTLEFAPTGLTIVYGGNGAGKSGYTRILKDACRARAKQTILGDVFGACNVEPEATLKFKRGANEVTWAWRPVGAEPGAPVEICVFDGECGAVHLQSEGELLFQPFGLDVLPKLAACCNFLKQKLEDKVTKLAAARAKLFVQPPWRLNSPVGTAMAALNHGSIAEEVIAKHGLTEEGTTRLKALEEQLASDPTTAARAEKNFADDLQRIIGELTRLQEEASDDSLNFLHKAERDAVAARAEADEAMAILKEEPLPGTGGGAWRELWAAARRFSTENAYPDEHFPVVHDGALCPLCQQRLEAGAQSRLERFNQFITGTIEAKAEARRITARAERERLERFAPTPALDSWLRGLRDRHPETAGRVERYLGEAKRRVSEGLAALGQANWAPAAWKEADPTPELDKLRLVARQRESNLSDLASSEGRATAEEERTRLRESAAISESRAAIAAEIARLAEVEKIKDSIRECATTAITLYAKELTGHFLTEAVEGQFGDEMIALGAERVQVKLAQAAGQAGRAKFAFKLEGAPAANVPLVLSEGEKNCVALAGCLTEISHAAAGAALVLDDPTSSLDHVYRKQVAKRLCREGKSRQVVIFTHDMVFLGQLREAAELEGVARRFVYLERDGQPGVVSEFGPFDGMSFSDRINYLKKLAHEAGQLYDQGKDSAYAEKAKRLLSLLRASWERAVEDVALDGAVKRFEERIEPGKLRRVLKLTKQDCDDLTAGYKQCHGEIPAHDSAQAANSSPPPPIELSKRIQALEGWAGGINGRPEGKPKK